MSAAPVHPFEEWLLANHVDADTPVGDLARDVRDGLYFPSEGERADLRRHMKHGPHPADSTFLLCFEEAWRLYEPDGSPADHPFVTFLLHRDLRDGTPLSEFAAEFANIFPEQGGREALHRTLEDYLGGDPDEDDPTSWALNCFDVSWNQFQPTCETPGCTSVVAPPLCELHALAWDMRRAA